MKVDGFRFDLATILGREPYGFRRGRRLPRHLPAGPVLNGVKLIAEPWDCRPRRLSGRGFPPGWAEWNDRFRDDVRAYGGAIPACSRTSPPGSRARPTSSTSAGRKPWASVNFLTAHDGFTLHDTVAYNEKHNEANGEGNRDGHSHNLSYNYGVEGPTDDPRSRRCACARCATCWRPCSCPAARRCCWPATSSPAPRACNNNAYCQDNEVSWLDWGAIGDAQRDLAEFTQRLIILRNALPILTADASSPAIRR